MSTEHTETVDEREQLMSLIGSGYMNEPEENTHTEEVKAAYAELAKTNRQRFEEIPVDVEFTESDPYESYDHMIQEVDRTGVMKIFGGGTHPDYLTHEENLQGRAVHDWFGHIQLGVDFSLEGEWAKWRGMSDHYSENAHRLLFTEVVGQLCVAHVVGGFDSPAFEQRGIIAPDRWIDAADGYMKRHNPDY